VFDVNVYTRCHVVTFMHPLKQDREGGRQGGLCVNRGRPCVQEEEGCLFHWTQDRGLMSCFRVLCLSYAGVVAFPSVAWLYTCCSKHTACISSKGFEGFLSQLVFSAVQGIPTWLQCVLLCRHSLSFEHCTVDADSEQQAVCHCVDRTLQGAICHQACHVLIQVDTGQSLWEQVYCACSTGAEQVLLSCTT
jgi:hypothetical protein